MGISVLPGMGTGIRWWFRLVASMVRVRARDRWLVALALLGFLAAVVAAGAAKASRPERYSTPALSSLAPRSSSAPPIADTRQLPPPRSWNLHVPWWLVQRLLVVLLAVAMVLVILAIVRWMPRLQRNRFRPAGDEDVAYAPDGHAQVVREVTAAVDDALDRFRQGDRERAVIACWIRLEQIAEQAGFGRRRSETSSELADRWQAQLPVSREPLRALAELYREARYSSHPVPDEAIETARRALGRLRREITEPAVAGQP